MKKIDNLNNRASSALLSPFAKMNSVSRLDMVASAFKHAVIPVNPDYPIVDSAYTNDILLSTDNKVVHGGVKLLHSIPKVLNGITTEMCFIYEDLSDNEVKLTIVPNYETCYNFGYGVKSELENMKPGEIKEGDVYVKHYDFYNFEDNIVSFGQNMKIIYDISKRVAEDSILISESAANKFARPHQEEIEFTISPDFILRDLYGDDDNYKPLPMVGDKLKDGYIASMYLDDSKSFLAYDDTEMLENDINIVTKFNDAEVIDIEVYSKHSNGAIPIPHLEQTRLEFNKYMQNIVNAITATESQYPINKIHYSLKNLKNKYTLILNTAALRWGTNELKNNIAVKYKIRSVRPLRPGDKLSNRQGGKGTNAIVVKDEHMYYYDWIMTPNGPSKVKMYIDAMVNATGVFNRENISQLFERDLNTLWGFVVTYLITSGDSYEAKKENILKWLEYARQPFAIEVLKDVDAKELVTYYIDRNNDIRLTYEPYDNPDDQIRMNSVVLRELTWFTDTLTSVEPTEIFIGDLPLSEKHFVGKVFYLVLANGDFKATSIRGNEGTNSKGNPAKKARDNKRNLSKYGSTAVKQSDFALSNTLNAIHTEDKIMLRNNSQPLHDYLNAIGIEIIEYDEE